MGTDPKEETSPTAEVLPAVLVSNVRGGSPGACTPEIPSKCPSSPAFPDECNPPAETAVPKLAQPVPVPGASGLKCSLSPYSSNALSSHGATTPRTRGPEPVTAVLASHGKTLASFAP